MTPDLLGRGPVPATVAIDSVHSSAAHVTLGARGAEFHIHDKEFLHVFPFNEWIFRSPSQRVGVDVYEFNGPNLGFYHDTVDMREGPYINHFISHVRVSIAYATEDEASVTIEGTADWARSSFDNDTHRAAPTGAWIFKACFVHRF